MPRPEWVLLLRIMLHFGDRKLLNTKDSTSLAIIEQTQRVHPLVWGSMVLLRRGASGLLNSLMRSESRVRKNVENQCELLIQTSHLQIHQDRIASHQGSILLHHSD